VEHLSFDGNGSLATNEMEHYGDNLTNPMRIGMTPIMTPVTFMY